MSVEHSNEASEGQNQLVKTRAGACADASASPTRRLAASELRRQERGSWGLGVSLPVLDLEVAALLRPRRISEPKLPSAFGHCALAPFPLPRATPRPRGSKRHIKIQLSNRHMPDIYMVLCGCVLVILGAVVLCSSVHECACKHCKCSQVPRLSSEIVPPSVLESCRSAVPTPASHCLVVVPPSFGIT